MAVSVSAQVPSLWSRLLNDFDGIAALNHLPSSTSPDPAIVSSTASASSLVTKELASNRSLVYMAWTASATAIMDTGGSGPWPTPSLSEASVATQRSRHQNHQSSHGHIGDLGASSSSSSLSAVPPPVAASCSALARLLQWFIASWPRFPLLGDHGAVVRWRLFSTIRWIGNAVDDDTQSLAATAYVMQPSYDLLRTLMVPATPSSLASNTLMMAHVTASASAARINAATAMVTTVSEAKEPIISSNDTAATAATSSSSTLVHHDTGSGTPSTTQSVHSSPHHGPMSVSVTEATPVRAPIALSQLRASASASPPSPASTITLSGGSKPASRSGSLSAVPAVVLTIRRPSSPSVPLALLAANLAAAASNSSSSSSTSSSGGSHSSPKLLSSSSTTSITMSNAAGPGSPKFVLYPTSTAAALQSSTSDSNNNGDRSSPRAMAASAAAAAVTNMSSSSSSPQSPPTFFLPPSPVPPHTIQPPGHAVNNTTVSLAPIVSTSSSSTFSSSPPGSRHGSVSHTLAPMIHLPHNDLSPPMSMAYHIAHAQLHAPPVIPLPPSFTLDQLVALLPFTEPSYAEVTAIEHALAGTHDRLDMYICMIQYLRYLDKETQSSPAVAVASSPSSRLQSFASTILVDSTPKLHFLAGLACANLKKYPPSPLIAPTLLDIVSHGLTSTTSSSPANNGNGSPGLGGTPSDATGFTGGGLGGGGTNPLDSSDQPLSAMAAVRLALTGAGIEFRKFDTTRPPYYALQSVDRIIELKEAAKAKKAKRLDIRHTRLAYTDRYVRNAYAHVATTAVIATVEDMWMQVDPRPDRLIRIDRGDPHIPDGVEEIVTSITSGRLVLTRETLTWTPEISLGDTAGGDVPPAPNQSRPGVAATDHHGGYQPQLLHKEPLGGGQLAAGARAGGGGGHFRSNSFTGTQSRRAPASSSALVGDRSHATETRLAALTGLAMGYRDDGTVISPVARSKTILALGSPKAGDGTALGSAPNSSHDVLGSPTGASGSNNNSPATFTRRAHAHTKSSAAAATSPPSVTSEASAATSPLKKWRPNRSTAPAGTSFWPGTGSTSPPTGQPPVVWNANAAATSSSAATPSTSTTTSTAAVPDGPPPAYPGSGSPHDRVATPPMPPVAAVAPIRTRTSTHTMITTLDTVPQSPSQSVGSSHSATLSTSANHHSGVGSPGGIGSSRHRRIASDGDSAADVIMPLPGAALRQETTTGPYSSLEIKLDPPLPGAVEILTTVGTNGSDKTHIPSNNDSHHNDDYISLAAALRMEPAPISILSNNQSGSSGLERKKHHSSQQSVTIAVASNLEAAERKRKQLADDDATDKIDFAALMASTRIKTTPPVTDAPSADNRLVIRLRDVQRFTSGEIEHVVQKPNNPLPLFGGKRPAISERKAGGGSGNNGGAPADQWAEEDAQAPTAAYYLCIHYADQSFKFFPFFNSEIAEMIGALSDLIGQDPFDEYDYVHMVLKKRQEALRAAILSEFSSHTEVVDPTDPEATTADHILAMTPPAWINHTIPLTHVIESLTSDTRDQRIVDLERLFHSCRLNKEVTFVTMSMLQKKWIHDKNHEAIRVKILVVIERLLDRAIMGANDHLFKRLVRWLQLIETELDPYKSPQSAKILSDLRKQAEDIRAQPLQTISTHHLGDAFSDLDRFADFRRRMAADQSVARTNARPKPPPDPRLVRRAKARAAQALRLGLSSKKKK